MRIFAITIFSLLLTIPSFGQEMSDADYLKSIETHRKEYKKALAIDEMAPINDKKDLKNMHFFETDPSWKVKCLFIRTYEAKPFEMATFSGEKKPYIKYGELLFELPGKGTQRINVYQSLKSLKVPAYKNLLFVPFTDLTNGKTTFEGGRYIDIKINDTQQGIVYLDFNKAYNPWCAYGDGFSCPIPPQENSMNLEINAGEKIYTGNELEMAGQ